MAKRGATSQVRTTHRAGNRTWNSDPRISCCQITREGGVDGAGDDEIENVSARSLSCHLRRRSILASDFSVPLQEKTDMPVARDLGARKSVQQALVARSPLTTGMSLPLFLLSYLFARSIQDSRPADSQECYAFGD